MNNFVKDIKAATNLFVDMWKARKAGKEVVVEKKKRIPVYSVGIGFYDTIEGCALANCKMDGVCDIARKTFYELPNEIKEGLSSSPEDGEFIDRAFFWNELLQTVMEPKQNNSAMLVILKSYIRIKKMRVEKNHMEEIIITRISNTTKIEQNAIREKNLA